MPLMQYHKAVKWVTITCILLWSILTMASFAVLATYRVVRHLIGYYGFSGPIGTLLAITVVVLLVTMLATLHRRISTEKKAPLLVVALVGASWLTLVLALGYTTGFVGASLVAEMLVFTASLSALLTALLLLTWLISSKLKRRKTVEEYIAEASQRAL